MKVKSLLVLLFLISTFSQSNSKANMYAGLFYPVAENYTLRNEYNIAIPYVFPEIGMTFGLNDFFDLSVDIGYRSFTMRQDNKTAIYTTGNKLKVKSMIEEVIDNNSGQYSNDGLTLHIIPITVMTTHFFAKHRKFVPYLSLGLADYSAFMFKTLHSTSSNATITGTYDKFEFQNGIGLVFDAGVNVNLGKDNFVGLAIRYDYTFIGTAKNGGLENVGGASFKLRYFFNL